MDRDGNHVNGNHLYVLNSQHREPQIFSNNASTSPPRSNSSTHLNERIVTVSLLYFFPYRLLKSAALKFIFTFLKECRSIGKLTNRASFYRSYDACTTIGRGNFARVFLLQKSTQQASTKLAVKVSIL